MTNREIFKNYVRNSGKKFLCSPQIGAGAGFDARMTGKTWLGDVTVQDTMTVCRQFDMVPLYNMGIPALTTLTDSVTETSSREITREGTRRIDRSVFHTPRGDLYACSVSDEMKGGSPIESYVKDEEDLDVLEYYLDALLEEAEGFGVTRAVGLWQELR